MRNQGKHTGKRNSYGRFAGNSNHTNYRSAGSEYPDERRNDTSGHYNNDRNRSWHDRGDFYKDERRHDSYGHFNRERDERSRYPDEHYDRENAHGLGGNGRGWYGDSERHALAAERGWDNRHNGLGYGGYDNYDRGFDDRGQDGYRNDSYRYEANRDRRQGDYIRNDDYPDNDFSLGNSYGRESGRGRGWYGDSQGHSDAARGWSGRDGQPARRGNHADGNYNSRNRYEEAYEKEGYSSRGRYKNW